MTKTVALLRFCYRFLIGDDWRITTGSAAALALTAAAAQAGIPAWWIAPVAVLAILSSVLLTRPSRRRRSAAKRNR